MNIKRFEDLEIWKEAAGFGDLYVGVGSDKTIWELKGRNPIYSEAERV